MHHQFLCSGTLNVIQIINSILVIMRLRSHQKSQKNKHISDVIRKTSSIIYHIIQQLPNV